MQKIWKCGFLATVTLFLAACSSSGGGGVVAVSSYADLEECTSATEGSVRLVSDENLQYRCTDGDWEEYVPVAQSPAQGGYSGAPSWGGKGQLRDSRDGQIYRTVTIGNQTWMAQNLNYETEDSYCYDDKPANCATYGRLYIWKAALDACPSGWHLPSKEEFEVLLAAVGGIQDAEENWEWQGAGRKLKSVAGWNNYEGKSGNGSDDFGFSALAAGARDHHVDHIFHLKGFRTFFWSATIHNGNMYTLDLYRKDGDAALVDNSFGGDGFSVRCVKD
ncbi:MAG: fibrobacter succinogenes major paralogous domain-containing protein [Fibrobacter sp.]|nr:fibrobacter succinogenes major paralogous domain-containing protein [Fibrobacter sp.]